MKHWVPETKPKNEQQAAGAAPRLLILDDEKPTLDIMEMAFKRRGFDVITRQAGPDFDTPAELATIMDETKPDCLLTDFNMGPLTGADAFETARTYNPIMPVILHTNNMAEVEAVESRLYGITALRHKPTGNHELKEHVDACTDLFSKALRSFGRLNIFPDDDTPKGQSR